MAVAVAHRQSLLPHKLALTVDSMELVEGVEVQV
jgi:hypothetical protein